MSKTTEIPDQKQRNLINTELSSSFFVEASAGSGKTRCLVERMVEHVFELPQKEDISKMVAITFTKKAAQEFKGRFQEKLEERAKSSSIAADKQERIYYALENVENIFMGTIHAFCSRLLRERPVEANVNIGFQELDNEENEKFLKDTWNIFLNCEEGKELQETVKEWGFHVPMLYETFLEIDRYGEIDFLDHVEKEMAGHAEDYKNMIQEIWNYFDYLQGIFKLKKDGTKMKISIFESNEKKDKFLKMKSEYSGREGELSKLEIRNIIDSFLAAELKAPQEINDKTKEAERNWFTTRNQENQKLKEFIKKHIHPCQLDLYYQCVLFCKKAAQFAAQRRKDLSYISFLELLLYTRDMLKDNLEALNYFKGKYQYFYVDEFQDTDPLQTEILLYLTQDGAAEKYEANSSWKDLKPRPGSLFIVGDDKQSIYRFARVDISNFNFMKEHLEEASPENSGKLAKLTTNFRSVKELCQEINEVFVKLLQEGESKTQVSYEEVSSGREPVAGENAGKVNAGIKVFPQIELQEKNKESLLNEDAPRVADFIQQKVLSENFYLARFNGEKEPEVATPAEYRDFMIITYDTNDLDIYAYELQKRQIPYIMAGKSAFSNSLEVKELIKILESIASPYDEVKTVAALRSLFLGVSDQDLYIYRMSGRSFRIFRDNTNKPEDIQTFWDHTGSGVEVNFNNKDLSDTISKVEQKLNLLEEYCHWANLYPPVVLLEKIIENLEVVPFSLASVGQEGESRLNLLYQLLEAVRSEEVKGNIYNTTSLILQINEWNEKNIEKEMPFESEANSVRLMNLHKAKGLEAPVVILAKPCGKVKHPTTLHIDRTDGRHSRGYLNITEKIEIPGGPKTRVLFKVSSWDDKFRLEEKLLEEEHLRKLYVAATRAQNVLIISNSTEAISKHARPWNELWNMLAEIEKNGGKSLEEREIQVSPVSKPPGIEEAEIVNKDQLTAFQEQIQSQLQNIRKSTFGHAIPSELDKKPSSSIWNKLVKEINQKIRGKEQENQKLETKEDYSSLIEDAVDFVLDEQLNEEIKAKQEFSNMLHTQGISEKELRQALIDHHITKMSEGGKRGPLWGTMVHLLLEYLVDQRENLSISENRSVLIEQLVRKTLGAALYNKEWNSKDVKILLKALGLEMETPSGKKLHIALNELLFPELVEVAQKFMNCAYSQLDDNRKNLWQRIQNSELVMTEYSFEVLLNKEIDSELFSLCAHDYNKDGNRDFPGQLTFSGVIDLLFKENGNWVIVDYKTNAVNDLLELDEMYQNQLNAYKLLWERITGEPVKDSITYHISYKELHAEPKGYLNLSLADFVAEINKSDIASHLYSQTGLSKARLIGFLFLTTCNMFSYARSKKDFFQQYDFVGVKESYQFRNESACSQAIQKLFNADSFQDVLSQSQQFVQEITTVGELLEKMIENESDSRAKDDWRRVKASLEGSNEESLEGEYREREG